MDWKSVLGAVAPLAATAIGGPFGGLAVAAIGKAFNMSEPTVDKIQKAMQDSQLSAEQIVALKQAEADLKVKMRELDITEEQLAYQDTDSARKMQMSNRSAVPAWLTFVVTAGFLGILVGAMLGYLKLDSSPPLLLLLGALGTAWGSVMQFWFGTTHESGKKTDAIVNQLGQQ